MVRLTTTFMPLHGFLSALILRKFAWRQVKGKPSFTVWPTTQVYWHFQACFDLVSVWQGLCLGSWFSILALWNVLYLNLTVFLSLPGQRTSLESGWTSIRNIAVCGQTCSCQQAWHSYNQQPTQRECGVVHGSCGGMGEAWWLYLSEGKQTMFQLFGVLSWWVNR